MNRHEAMPTMLAGKAASSSYAGGDFDWNTTPLANTLVGLKQANNLETAQLKGNKMSRRIIQIFIADPNENVPLDACILFKGEQKLTDATDQELFFELDIKSILEKHNEARIKVIDKKVKDRTEYLEPAKVRDLKMVVVTVATL